MLIGITSRVGEGKTSIAKHLEKNYEFLILSFSTPLKRAVAGLFGIPMITLMDPKLKEHHLPEWDKTSREILQIFATECMRNHFGHDFWIKAMLYELMKHSQEHIVIDDVRFQNELDFVYKQEGQMIHVTRPNNPYQINQSHLSEQRLYFDNRIIEVVNDSTLEELGNKIDRLTVVKGENKWKIKI